MEIQIAWLRNRAPFDRSEGIEHGDRRWKAQLTRLLKKGSLELPKGTEENPKRIREAVNAVAERTYYMARIAQTYFENPNLGNYKDPFVEALFILLTWRSRIDDAKELLGDILSEFRGPAELLEDQARDKLDEIVKRAGFSKKRPEMIIQLVRRFTERFPNGDAGSMADWDDEEVIEFLTSIPGIGMKSALCVLMYSLGRERFPIDAHIRRVLRRTALLSELYLEHEEKEHRVFQAEVEQYIAPSTRFALHTGLISVGKAFCLPKRPRCYACPVRRICSYHRKREVASSENRRFTHIDLFCGAGGFSTGFAREGYRTLLAVDSYCSACESFRLNHPDVPEGNVIHADLAENSPSQIREGLESWRDSVVTGRVDVITAGIPCQGFSKAGYRSRPDLDYDPMEDPRNQLYSVVLQWAKYLQPRYVVIENVPDMRSAGKDESKILELVCDAFRTAGYVVDFETVNAAEYGVPQIRRRLILIASDPSVPPVTIGDLDDYVEDTVTLSSAIGDLPPLEAGKGRWYQLTRKGVITGHVARYTNREDLKIFRALRPGEGYIEFVKRRADIIENRRLHSTRAVYSTKSFSDKYHKLEPDRPSRTIVAHLQRDGNGYIHPEQARSLTPREALRIQGFDDDSVICGSRGSQFIQIGNAIPPGLARIIGRVLAKRLERVGQN